MTALLVLWLVQAAPPPFDTVTATLAARRTELAARHRQAPAAQRPAIVAEARALLVRAIAGELFPAWLGTRWGLGPNSDASRPHQPGKVVGCSYFVTAVLENAGLVLESRARFAQAPALWIERALLPAGGRVHRLGALDAEELRARVAALGDGLYLVGLDIHVGFLVVRGRDVRIVHASYAAPYTVVSEPITASEVIANSRARGYFVSALFQDDRLVELWLRGAAVPAPPQWPPLRR
jgi:hypothetical protein